MDTSQQMLLQLPEELRDEYQEREQARGPYDKAVEEAVKSGEEPPAPEEGIDVRSMEELQTELEKQEANLEMNANTNPGVVEQYEKRKRDVRVLSLYPSFDGYLTDSWCRLKRWRSPSNSATAARISLRRISRMHGYAFVSPLFTYLMHISAVGQLGACAAGSCRKHREEVFCCF
jgi:hypothetical protein